MSYITSRLIVMSYPAEGVESAIKNHIDDVRELLETNHSGSFAVYNLSNRSYRTAKFQNRVSVHICSTKNHESFKLITFITAKFQVDIVQYCCCQTPLIVPFVSFVQCVSECFFFVLAHPDCPDQSTNLEFPSCFAYFPSAFSYS